MFENKNMLLSDFLFKNNHFQVINQKTWTQNTIIKTKQTMFENKNMLLSDIFAV